MALERLQARATARIPYLDCAVVRRRRQPCRVVREGDRGDVTAMALERLQARATARIPYLDCAVVRRRRQPCRVVREGDWATTLLWPSSVCRHAPLLASHILTVRSSDADASRVES